jgi:hypothetical protein
LPPTDARRQVKWAGGARRLAAATRGDICTNAKDREPA